MILVVLFSSSQLFIAQLCRKFFLFRELNLMWISNFVSLTRVELWYRWCCNQKYQNFSIFKLNLIEDCICLNSNQFRQFESPNITIERCGPIPSPHVWYLKSIFITGRRVFSTYIVCISSVFKFCPDKRRYYCLLRHDFCWSWFFFFTFFTIFWIRNLKNECSTFQYVLVFQYCMTAPPTRSMDY